MSAQLTSGDVHVAIDADGVTVSVGKAGWELVGPEVEDTSADRALAFLDALEADLRAARAFVLENTKREPCGCGGAAAQAPAMRPRVRVSKPLLPRRCNAACGRAAEVEVAVEGSNARTVTGLCGTHTGELLIAINQHLDQGGPQ
jgi:hypothetical protein